MAGKISKTPSSKKSKSVDLPTGNVTSNTESSSSSSGSSSESAQSTPQKKKKKKKRKSKSKSEKKSKRQKVDKPTEERWTEEAVKAMLDALQESPSGCDNGFKESDYKAAADKVVEEGWRKACTGRQVKTKLNNLKAEYKTVRHLMALSGAGFDPDNNTITLDESPFPHIAELEPFLASSAKGANARSSHQTPATVAKPKDQILPLDEDLDLDIESQLDILGADGSELGAARSELGAGFAAAASRRTSASGNVSGSSSVSRRSSASGNNPPIDLGVVLQQSLSTFQNYMQNTVNGLQTVKQSAPPPPPLPPPEQLFQFMELIDWSRYSKDQKNAIQKAAVQTLPDNPAKKEAFKTLVGSRKVMEPELFDALLLDMFKISA
ncbi:hypothetical protein HDV05_005687 [Chytridiales sp. JEL 0842]|nr:hypothetical protein HDV05_005687 [Chytridiales sp. JEL 0842]